MSSKFLKKSINILKAMNASYKIIMPDGQVFISEAKAFTGRRRRKAVRGLMSKHYLPYIKSIKHGELIEVPYAKFKGDDLQRSISSYARYLYGKGSVLTSRNDKRKVIEIMRA